jgi:hypothetical protein
MTKHAKAMRRNPSSSVKLTFEQKLAIIRALWPLGDRVWEFLDAMKGDGFAAFVPREQWIQSFAEGSKEIEGHHEFVREWAKYAFGLGLAPLGFGEYREHGFPSGLQRLREIRDKRNDGVPEAELHQHFDQLECSWRTEIDVCRRRMRQSGHPPGTNAVQAKERAAIAAEASVHATRLSRGYAMWTMVLRDRIAFSKRMLRGVLAPLGFRVDRNRSTFIAPVFAKAITPDWDLCFELVPDGIFFDAVSGTFDCRLSLRAGRDLGSFDPDLHLEIRYFAILDALHVYSGFTSIGELETVILARAFLYKLMAPGLEGILKAHLTHESAAVS